MHLFAAHQYSDWLVTAAVSILAAAALLITIHSFYKSRKNLLIKNAAMQQAEEKLRESNEWLQAIFDASRDGIVIEDGSEIVYVNKAFAQLLGYKEPEEVIGKDASEVLPPDEAERLAEYGRRRLRGEYAPTLYECKVKHKDGTLIEMEGSVSTAVIGGKKYITTANR
ncbi:MAG: PAS domain S-box protein, partial [Pyrinomonadaceae bacterium]